MHYNNNKIYIFLVSGFALFAMYFGAGNLIFPVMIGVDSGTNITAATLGFLATGVLLPLLGMIAASTARPEEKDTIAGRIGHLLGRTFLIIVFLSTGMLYAIPRVATVSYEIAIKPLLAEHSAGADRIWLFAFLVVFFAITSFFVLSPGTIIDRVGAILTPILLIFLLILIATVVTTLPALSTAPANDYVHAPLQTGLIQGYFTMDAIASLVFGFVIIFEMRKRGFETPRSLLKATSIVAAIAGLLLAIIYIGLAAIGVRIADQNYSNGAEALAHTAIRVFGHAGLFVFGVIVLFACLTTATGLITSSAHYFHSLLPSLSYRTFVIIHLLVSLILANLGLQAILAVVAPINQLIYPVAICLILLAVAEGLSGIHFFWTYRTTAWAAAFVSIFEALWSTNLDAFAPLRGYLDLLPGGSVHMPWVAPAAIALVIGLIIDASTRRLSRTTH